MSAHAAAMDAYHYWRQFEVVATWDKPKELVGEVLDLGQQKVDGEFAPRLRIRDERGVIVRVVVTQERLLAALVDACPKKGDRIKIRYTGDAKRAAPAMTPAKQFTVEVLKPPAAVK